MDRAFLIALVCILAACETEVQTISVAEDINTNIEGAVDNDQGCFASSPPPLFVSNTPTGTASTTFGPFVVVEAFTPDGFLVTVHEDGEDGELLAEQLSPYDVMDAPFAFDLSAVAASGDALQATFTVVESCEF
jgi:hypothetical protein